MGTFPHLPLFASELEGISLRPAVYDLLHTVLQIPDQLLFTPHN